MPSSSPVHAHRQRQPEAQEGFLYTAGPALASGAAQAVLFNPIDRALYVRVRFRRKRFLDWRNFERPFQGFLNAAVYRTLVGASYMFWQDSARIYIERFLPQRFQADTSPQLNSFTTGLFAGSINGFALNTLQAVKFRMWNTDAKSATFARTAHLMYQEGGFAIFFRGSMTTMVRDSIFGVVYETTRRAAVWREFFDEHVRVIIGYAKKDGGSSFERGSAKRASTAPPSSSVAGTEGAPQIPCAPCAFMSNLAAAVLASMLSSPFNYVRSIVYGTPPGAIPLGYITLLKSFYTQFFFIWRQGQSYTDYHRIPQLRDIEHATVADAKVGAVSSAASRETASGAVQNGIRRSPAAAAAAATVNEPLRRGRLRTLQRRMQQWGRAHHQHPFAAWKWANSRLNIGWGSFRVGLGMAMSQSLFHLAQDFARMRSSRGTA